MSAILSSAPARRRVGCALPGATEKGSSPNSGERGADLQEEVGVITTAPAVQMAADRLEPDHADRLTRPNVVPVLRKVIAFRASQPGNRMTVGHGRRPAVLAYGNNKFAVVAMSPLSSPRTSEKNQKSRPGDEPGLQCRFFFGLRG